MIDWFAKASKWRGGSTFAGHVNNIFDATIDVFTEDEKQVAYKAAPLFAPIDRGAGGGSGAPAPEAAGPARGGRAGGRGARGPSVPLDRQERYDNLVFPRGGGPGSLAGRGGAPNATDGERVFRDTCAQCHRFGTLGKDFAPDLTKVADRLPRRDILRSIFFPNEKVDPKFATTVLATKDGRLGSRAGRQRDGAERGDQDRDRGGAHDRAEGADRQADDRADVDHAGRPAGQGDRRGRPRRDRLHHADGEVAFSSGGMRWC